MIQLSCPYCRAPTRIADASLVYGKPGFGRVLVCTAYPGCDAYVGLHADRTDGKGSLAKGPLRRMRRRCHELFDPLWMRETPFRRKDLYFAAAKFFKVTDFHIGHLDESAAQDFIERFPAFRAALDRKAKRLGLAPSPSPASKPARARGQASTATAAPA